MNEGLIIHPLSTAMTIDCYVDSDFAGLWKIDNPQDSQSAQSRTGYLVELGGSPLLWASKMQTEVASSTCEAEYIALSTAMRALLPVRHIYEVVCVSLNLDRNPNSVISTVFEDNCAAKILATTDPPRLTPQSRHIAVKYHWF